MPVSTKVGLLAYSTNTGLGILTWEFARHMNPAKVLLVDLSGYNHMAIHPERYADFPVIACKGFPSPADIDEFLDGLDVVFVAETPLNYRLFSRARELGVRIVFQPMHEFNDYHCKTLPKPDLFALPSPWYYDDCPGPKMLLPVPVAKMPQQHVTSFRRFLHIAGRPAIHDRNGTTETIEAFKLLPQPDVTLTVRIQDGAAASALRATCADDVRITVDCRDIPDYRDAYDGFDCLVMPRKYGGLCLPMQEALGSGLPVIMTAISPNDAVLPSDWLVAAERTGSFMTRCEIDIFQADATALADKMTELYAKDADETCAIARALGDALSWENQLGSYQKALGATMSEESQS